MHNRVSSFLYFEVAKDKIPLTGYFKEWYFVIACSVYIWMNNVNSVANHSYSHSVFGTEVGLKMTNISNRLASILKSRLLS